MADLKTVYAAVDGPGRLLRALGQEIPKNISILARESAESQHLFQVPAGGAEADLYHHAIEGFNRKLRKVTKSKSVFPTNDSLFKMLYLPMMDITK